MMGKPRIIEGVWIGKLSDIGYVVYDPAIHNLYEYDREKIDLVDLSWMFSDKRDDVLKKISLWVYELRVRQYFDVASVRNDLRSNIPLISEFNRRRIANSYHQWRYRASGCNTKQEFNSKC